MCIHTSTCSLKFLGVELDADLKFNTHANNVSKKISKSTGIIRKLFEFLPTPTLRNIYFSMVDPYLNYCSIIFGGAYDVHLNNIIISQKKVLEH